MTARSGKPQAGFSLIEVLIASGITIVVAIIACRLAVDANIVWRADSARIDLQQRARVAADLVTRALLEAGGGPTGGPARGGLVRVLPPLVPRRMGLRGAHPPETFRSDAWTVVRAIAESEHAALLLPAPAGAGMIEIAPAPLCGLPACGFAVGAHVLIVDGTGNFDIFTVTDVQGMALSLRHHGPGNASPYPAGSPVVAVDSASFVHDPTTKTLRVYDGDASDMPLVDDVVGVEVRWFGDGQPPARPKAAPGSSNCLYARDGGYLSALMPVLPAVAGSVELTGEMLTDGPWCGSGATRFDADLLRVRHIRVTVRLQAADPAVRGINRSQFRERGVARTSAALVPDASVVIDVTPRNLVQGW